VLYRLLKHGFDAPPFCLAQRPTLLDQYHVSDIATVLRIIGMILDAGSDIFAIQFVAKFSLDTNDYRLLHRIADNRASPGFPYFFIFTHNVHYAVMRLPYDQAL